MLIAPSAVARGFGVAHVSLGFVVVLIALLLVANAFFVSERFLFALPLKGPKSLFLRFVELALLYGACLLLGRLAESRLHGAPYPQSWEFYVIGICLFLVAAFPGFIYRYMWRKDG